MVDLDERIKEMENKDQKQTAKTYFENGKILQNLFDIVKKNFDVIEPMGNFSSKFMIVLNDSDISLNNNVIKIIKKFYEINNKNMYDDYITLYDKTDNAKINQAVLQKEIQILQPQRIIYLGFSSKGKHVMSNVDFDIFKHSLGNKEKISKPEYVSAKNVFINLMKYIMTGVE